MDSTISEVFADFLTLLANIDFKAYNPNSQEFTSALNAGLMWHLLSEMKETDVPETKMPAMAESEDEISDELHGAKKYYQKFLDGGDTAFKEMAEDELKHAGILIKKANSKLPSGEEKAKLKSYEAELKELSDMINA